LEGLLGGLKTARRQDQLCEFGQVYRQYESKGVSQRTQLFREYPKRRMWKAIQKLYSFKNMHHIIGKLEINTNQLDGYVRAPRQEPS
jgi:hypothetical protein